MIQHFLAVFSFLMGFSSPSITTEGRTPYSIYFYLIWRNKILQFIKQPPTSLQQTLKIDSYLIQNQRVMKLNATFQQLNPRPPRVIPQAVNLVNLPQYLNLLNYNLHTLAIYTHIIQRTPSQEMVKTLRSDLQFKLFQ